MTRCKRLQSAFVLLISMLFLQVLQARAQALQPHSSLYLERLDTGAGAELLTLFSKSNDQPEPVISILRDTLGDLDPANDKIRYIWVLNHAQPSFEQRLQAGLPFFNFRSGAPTTSRKGKPPAPTVDYSATGSRAFRGVLGKLLQRGFLDPNGTLLRAASRNYVGNASTYRNMRINSMLETISKPAGQCELNGLSADDLTRIQGRLILTQRLLGDLVRESYLISAKKHNDMRNRSMRASNWELLRQKAEANKLYFQQLSFESDEPSHVLLWVAREDLDVQNYFDKKLLQISSPWGDKRVERIGYNEIWYFDAQDRRVEPGSPGARAVEVIPLALYGLNHPKVPLLIVDFRSPGKVRRTEIGRSAIDHAVNGVFALSAFGNWTYLGVRTSWHFFRGRWGVPINRQARLNAYSSLRSALATDTSLNPQLRSIIAQSLDGLSVNPFERGLEEEATVAEQQYQDLTTWARSPTGLAARLKREREYEMVAVTHGKPVRGLFMLARIASFGLYHHREESSPELMDRLDRQRRIAYHVSRLKEILESSPRLEVVANVDDIRDSLESLTVLSEQDVPSRKAVAKLVTQLFNQTEDAGLRRQCIESLAIIQDPDAATALAGLLDQSGATASTDPAETGVLESNAEILDVQQAEAQ